MGRKIQDNYKKEIDRRMCDIDLKYKKICKRIYRRYSTYYWEYEEETTFNFEEKIKENFVKKVYEKPSDIFKDENKIILDVFIEKDLQQKYLYIIDKLNKFQLDSGYYRRSTRIDKYTTKVYDIFKIMCNFSKLSLLPYSLSDIMTRSLDKEVKEDVIKYINIEDIIASFLDFQDKEIESIVEEIILSENNTYIVSDEIIRGIVKSDNEKMYKLLGDFLLAAKLQEGVRQSICENMDCGVTNSFIYLLEIINKNDLIRYSSVKRAVCTWIGIYDEENVHRVTKKIASIMIKSLKDSKYTKELLESKDEIEFMVGLWTLGFYNLRDVLKFVEKLMDINDEEKLIAVSNYLKIVDLNNFSYECSKKIVKKYPDNLKLIASYLSFYKKQLTYDYCDFGDHEKQCYIYSISNKRINYISEFFGDKEKAKEQYSILYKIFKDMKKSKIVFERESFIHSKIELTKSTLANIICNIAYMLNDKNIINECCKIIKNIDSYERNKFIKLLLKDPINENQRDVLINLVGDRDFSTSEEAFEVLNKIDLQINDFHNLGKIYSKKTGNIRAKATQLIMKAKDEDLKEVLEKLLSSSKEDVRMGALDILLALSKDKERNNFYEEIKEIVNKIDSPTDKEKSVIDLLLSSPKENSNLKYNLYNPKLDINLDKIEESVKVKEVKEIFNMKEEEARKIIDKLRLLINHNKDKVYTNAFNEEHLIGEKIWITSFDNNLTQVEALPYHELWSKFYEENINDSIKLLNLKLYIKDEIESLKFNKKYSDKLKELFNQDMSLKIKNSKYGDSIEMIIDSFYETYMDKKVAFEAGKKVLSKLDEKVDNKFIYLDKIKILVESLDNWEDDNEFLESFLIRYKLDKLYNFNTKGDSYYSESCTNVFDFIKLYKMNLIEEDVVYKKIFEELPLEQSVDTLSSLVEYMHDKDKKHRFEYIVIKYNKYFKSEEDFEFIYKMYKKIIDVILDVELSRGEGNTEFSKVIGKIDNIFSCEKFVKILKTLGNDKLARSHFYYSEYNSSKKETLSYLLKICKPLKSDNKEVLDNLLKNTKITKQRLIEAAMYNPDWIDIISDYLQIKDLKKGCYYFIAHMNDAYISDKTIAIIKKYTPLEIDELINGAFDINWFKEVYESLGEENFQMLYKAAKYISDGAKHTRGRYFADAVTNKLNKEEIKNKVKEKRNKDLLLAYSLIPLENREDLLKRYEYINEFLKESKQFGSQRRTSEKMTCDMAIRNLAINSGYKDSMRLILNLENELIENMSTYFEEKIIDDISVKIVIDENRKSFIECVKNNKKLKSIPSKYKKHEYVIKLKEIDKKLKEQFTRTKKMMEDAMENREEFYFEEIRNLINNKVVNSIVKNLVFINDDKVLGFVNEKNLEDVEGKIVELKDKDKIRVAHVYDLFKNKVLHKYQKFIFTKQIKQPFKQVFRELYVKTSDELNKNESLRYAGNQIQTRKTVSTLKNRDWVCDYENGLQKIYYKENIVATIYAEADWFSPSDIEAPTIENVTFYNRKTFKKIKIDEVPEIIFSEVMRDVDLAISVAHVGGVDPQTSMSTIEMRKEIFKFNLELFKLDNVKFNDKFAIIKGSRGEYSIHLGSGVVHQIGGSVINIVTIHSSHRGKIFLPFIDEDPKSAEIMSKIILFAQDKKIKDSYILEQICDF